MIPVQLSEKYIAGLSCRTQNQDEMNPATAKIGPAYGDYYEKGMANQLLQRLHPGRTIAVYTDYESDDKGFYTFLLGEEVASLEGQSLPSLKIPAGHYLRFETKKGPLAQVVLEQWMHIWSLPLKRLYQADFEVHFGDYAEIYIGVGESE